MSEAEDKQDGEMKRKVMVMISGASRCRGKAMSCEIMRRVEMVKWGIEMRGIGRAIEGRGAALYCDGVRRHGMAMTRGGKVKSRYDLLRYCMEQPGFALAMNRAVRRC